MTKLPDTLAIQGSPSNDLQRRAEGLKLHEIEGNPLSADDIAMFEMFDRQGWSHEQRIAYIRNKFTSESVPTAAE